MLKTSLPTMIAWLSVCVLAAAWGHVLDERWQVIWSEVGAFGIVSAAGLGAIEKVRAARTERSYNRVMQARVECGLARLNEHSATVDSINAAVRRLAEQAARRRTELGTQPRAKRHWHPQLLSDYPLEVIPVEDRDEPFDNTSISPIPGVLRQMSTQGVSFEHDESFSTRIVLLHFRLADEQQLSFVVDVMWTQKTVNGFTSGGTVLAVGVPTSDEPTDAEIDAVLSA
ncbi:MAG TPA: hypothetical protein VL175_02965 [Pirellulales bacterium]|jgi:hypothetical protein|nr:hypothetical protein [Pirellulales bacterium]